MIHWKKKSTSEFDQDFNENDIIKKKKDQCIPMIKILIIAPFFLIYCHFHHFH